MVMSGTLFYRDDRSYEVTCIYWEDSITIANIHALDENLCIVNSEVQFIFMVTFDV